MSDSQIARLSALLTRVQENRSRPKANAGDATAATSTVAGIGAPAFVPAGASLRAGPAAPAERARVSTPPGRSFPTAEPTSRRPPDRAQGRDAAFVPDEPAQRPPPVPAPDARREPASPQMPRAARPAAAPEPAEAIVPRVIEADIAREGTRPIAQIVSKHAPPVDATFGAMLKRSLSLRPH
jgi:hypothetical protein